jgi:Mg2+-importing ATPase
LYVSFEQSKIYFEETAMNHKQNSSYLKKGLTNSEAKAQLETYGENTIEKSKKVSLLRMFFRKLQNPLLILLITISIASFFLDQKTSAIFVMSMVVVSIILDFLNSYKSHKAVEQLISRVTTKVTVIRNGTKQDIDIINVVPRDLIFLSAGDIVPADSIVVESDDFFVNQSAMTGESIPVEKFPKEGALPQDLTADSPQVILMGTSVVTGFATVQAIQTGLQTEFGKLTKTLSKADPKTTFEISVMHFSVFIMQLVFCMASFVFIVYLIKNFGSWDNSSILEAFTFALAITIGVTPDMLPAIITVCLSRGSQMMSKKDVIVKQLSSIEDFGSMDILCTDKTGTLTQDHIALVKCIDFKGEDSSKVLTLGYLSSTYHTGVSNPLDNAIKETKKVDIKHYKKVDEIPYDFYRKRSSMVVDFEEHRYLITKGAPEEVFKICQHNESNDKTHDFQEKKELIEEEFTKLSADGFRVLGLCYKEIPQDENKVYDKEIEQKMTFIGFMAFLDPPKEGVAQTIDELKKLGVEVKILTGDNEVLTQKVCRDLGLKIDGILTGKQMRRLSDFELEQKVLQTNVFARVAPDQKERIILALKKHGKAVGYLGDGINDAPALKAADVGISVENGVDIAKDTADIILIQKSLKSLKDGVVEGRKTFHNTLKYLLMGLSSNFGNMFSMMAASTFLPFLPMLPAQILLNNAIYDFSQVSIPTDNVDPEDLLKPSHWDLPFIRTYMVVFGLISSVFDFLTFFLLYFVFRLEESQFQTGWFIESIATQILVIYVIRTQKIPFLESRPSLALFLTTFCAVAIAWIIPYTPLGGWINFGKLPLHIYLIIFGYVLVYMVLVQIAKVFFYRHQNSIEKTSVKTS